MQRFQSPRNTENDFPTRQLFLLGIVRLAEPIALTSIFPYAWSLIKQFQVGKESDASFYAGLLISAFSLTEALMGMFWGSLSDRIGRKPVLLLGCAGTTASLLMVGFAQNFWFALAARALGGMLNGNIGVIQTMVAEIVTRKEHEPRAYAIMPFVWCIGTIIGPSIGGIFAEPHKSWPNVFGENSLFTKFPYLLPNVICATLLLTSIAMAYFLLDETHPDMAPHVIRNNTYVSEETPLFETSDSLKQPPFDIRSETYGTIRRSIEHQRETPCDKKTQKHRQPSIFTKPVMALICALSLFTYHSMTYDHLLPIYFEDDRAPDMQTASFNPLQFSGGLGLSMQSVGVILAFNGAMALFVQVVIFPIAASYIGIYKLFVTVTILHPIVYAVMPMLVHVPESMLYPAIYSCLAIRNVLSIILYPLLLILIKEVTPCSSVLGKINGFAASAGAACRMIAPPVAGYLYTIGSQMDCTALAWYGSAFVAIIGAFQCLGVKRPRCEDSSEESTGGQTKQHAFTTITDIDEEN
ncbi:major facilitator superfamily transporter [Apiospora kogelbergensis]|uniref:major facilitator superfamily transporter n=1 Tax=Apiospora kogelbergensis TaxID=1337665 RepID=UPI00312DBE4F